MTQYLFALMMTSVSVNFVYALDNANSTLASPAHIARAEKLPGTLVVRISKTRIEIVDAVLVQKRLAEAEDFGTFQFTRIGNNVEESGALTPETSSSKKNVRYANEDTFHFSYHPRYSSGANFHHNSALSIAGYPIFTFEDDEFPYVYRPTWSTEDVKYVYVYYSWF